MESDDIEHGEAAKRDTRPVMDRLCLVSDSFRLAIQTAEEIFGGDVVDEEVTSAAFSGAMAAHSAWLVNPSAPIDVPLYISHFKKSKVDGRARRRIANGELPTHEIQSGADLAVVVGVNKKYSLLTLIQAKAAKGEGDKTIFRWGTEVKIRGAGDNAKDQLDAFIHFARSIQPSKPSGGSRSILDRLANLGPRIVPPWIHYLVFTAEQWTAIPVAHFVEVRDESLGNLGFSASHARLSMFPKRRSAEELFDFKAVSWEQTLGSRVANNPVSPESDKPSVPGWFTVENGIVEDLFSAISVHFNIFAVDDSTGFLKARLENALRGPVSILKVAKNKRRKRRRPG